MPTTDVRVASGLGWSVDVQLLTPQNRWTGLTVTNTSGRSLNFRMTAGAAVVAQIFGQGTTTFTFAAAVQLSSAVNWKGQTVLASSIAFALAVGQDG